MFSIFIYIDIISVEVVFGWRFKQGYYLYKGHYFCLLFLLLLLLLWSWHLSVKERNGNVVIGLYFPFPFDFNCPSTLEVMTQSYLGASLNVTGPVRRW